MSILNYLFLVRGHFVRRFFRRIMTPMSVENAQSKKNILAKAYFCISLATLCTVMYQVKQGRLNWLEAEGLIPEDETKLSPGKFKMLLSIIIIQVLIYNN